MKLAEALAERAELQRRIEQVAGRARQVVRVQEGDVPDEDPAALIAEAERALERLEELLARINATNAATPFDATMTITDAIARRDVLARRHQFYSALADAAGARQDRMMRSEIKFVATVDVRAVRAQADAAAQQHRALDTRLQQLNWQTELL